MPAPLVVAAASTALPKLVDYGIELIDRLWPDPTKADQAKLELLKLERSGQLAELESAKELALGQMEVNRVEASSPRVWVSGWRPGAGWAGVGGLVYAAIVSPFLSWVSALKGWPLPPELYTELLWLVLGTLLGVGSLRSLDKKNGVASQ